MKSRNIAYMAHSWFIYHDGHSSGPHSTEHVKEGIAKRIYGAGTLIWWKGQREWLSLESWLDQVDRLLQSSNQTQQKPVWYIDAGSSPIGPLSEKEMLENLRSVEELSQIRLWCVGMEKWQGIFEMHDVMENLGVSRREHERAPLMGVVAVARSSDAPKGIKAQAASISVAGIGLNEAQDLRRRDEVALLIRSPDLVDQVHVRGEVVYVTSKGYAGIRFISPSAEAVSIISDYVKKFTRNTSEQDQSNAA